MKILSILIILYASIQLSLHNPSATSFETIQPINHTSAIKITNNSEIYTAGFTIPGRALVRGIKIGLKKAVKRSMKTAGKSICSIGSNVSKLFKKKPKINTKYQRPKNATTKSQRKSVQGKKCVDCGNIKKPMVADHKKPLVKEYYEKGKIDIKRMKSIKAVQPQCKNCSNKQGGKLSGYGKKKAKELKLK